MWNTLFELWKSYLWWPLPLISLHFDWNDLFALVIGNDEFEAPIVADEPIVPVPRLVYLSADLHDTKKTLGDFGAKAKMAAPKGKQAVLEEEIRRGSRRRGGVNQTKIHQYQLATIVFSWRLSRLLVGRRGSRSRRFARGGERQRHRKVFGRLQNVENKITTRAAATTTRTTRTAGGRRTRKRIW